MRENFFDCPICNKKRAHKSYGLPTVVVCYCTGKCQEVGEVIEGSFFPSTKNVLKIENKSNFEYTIMHIKDEVVLKRIGQGLVHPCSIHPDLFLTKGTIHLIIPNNLQLESYKQKIDFINDNQSSLWKKVYLMIVDPNKEVKEFVSYKNYSVLEIEAKKIKSYMRSLDLIK